jgi:predicted metal-dependent hydrolase
MYVVLHEISHVACPIYDNHGPLFKKIFGFLTKIAINLGLYTKINFNENHTEYCGLMITDSII